MNTRDGVALGAAGALPSDPMPQPGWYADPTADDRLRLWDGVRWCEDTRPAPGAAAVMDERRSWLQIGSAVAVMAVMVALVGAPGRSVAPGPGPGWAAGGVLDQTIISVGVAVAGPPEPVLVTPTTTVRPVRTTPVTRPPTGAPRVLSARKAMVGDFRLTGFRWGPCSTITVSTSGPEVQPIVAELASVTGLALKMVTGAADIVVGWGPIPIKDAIGLAVLATVGPAIVHAVVTISRRGVPVLATLLRHEMAHALGLGHAKQSNEIMYPAARVGAPLDYQAGDLAGLRTLGATGSVC